MWISGGSFSLGLELAPQAPDVDVDDVALGLEVDAPHLLADGTSREHLLRMAHEELHQVVLGRGQVGGAPAALDDVAARVELHVGVLKHLGRRRPDVAQARLDARHQLGHRHRLDDVVVGTRIEAFQAVFGGVFGGQDDDRDSAPAGPAPNATDEFEPVAAGQHEVEDDDVWPELAQAVDGDEGVAGGVDLEVLLFERAADGLAKTAVVLDDKNARSGASRDPRWCRLFRLCGAFLHRAAPE